MSESKLERRRSRDSNGLRRFSWPAIGLIASMGTIVPRVTIRRVATLCVACQYVSCTRKNILNRRASQGHEEFRSESGSQPSWPSFSSVQSWFAPISSVTRRLALTEGFLEQKGTEITKNANIEFNTAIRNTRSFGPIAPAALQGGNLPRDLTDLGHFVGWQTHRILSPARLPSPSHWKQVAVVLNVCDSNARTSPPW
jgi:hypothetical protein